MSDAIYRVRIERYEPTQLGPIVSSYVTPKTVVSEEFYRNLDSAKERIEEIQAAQRVLGFDAVTANWQELELRP